MLFRMSRSGEEPQFHQLNERKAIDLELEEKDIETWLANHPKLLFGDEDVFVIAQSVRGQRMPDILALDADGHLIIVEVKLRQSYRQTAGQLLDYAADYSTWHYDALNKLYERYRNQDSPASILDCYRSLPGKDAAQQDDIAKECRLCIVAQGMDDGLERIIRWLRQLGVRISFIPFALFSDEEGQIVIDIDQIRNDDQKSADEDVGKWHGDWMFNTNERHRPGAYERMFKQGVIAVFGYDGPKNLDNATAGQRVFAYLNKRGFLAVGEIIDEKARKDTSVFGEKDEYHRKVKWSAVVSEVQGVTRSQIIDEGGKELPRQQTFCGLYKRCKTDWIEQQLREREQSKH